MSIILRAPNTDRLISGKAKTYLTAAQASGSSTITVESIAGFSTDQVLMLGTLGEEKTEIIKTHASTSPSGTTITFASNTSYRHEVGIPVQLVGYDQVEFTRATTTTGTKSTLTTIDITPDSMDTIYDDGTNTTGYGFYRWKNTIDTSYSSYSDPIPYAGYDLDAASNIIDRALSLAGTSLSPRLKYEQLFDFLNDFIAFANSRNTRWSECKVYDEELDTIATGDWEFSLPTTIAKKNDPSAIMNVRVRNYPALKYMPYREFSKAILDLKYTTLSSDLSSSDTTVSLTNSNGLNDSGSIEINGNSIDYTGNTRSTNTLTGVTGIESGGHSSGDYVFQGNVNSVPVIYTIPSEGKIRVWPICSSMVNNYVIYISYYKRIPTIDSVGDTILLQDVSPAIEYVAYRIKKYLAGGTLSVEDEEFQKFLSNFNSLINQNNPTEPIRISVDY